MSNANRNAQLILSLIAILISPLFGQDFATGPNSAYQAKEWQEETPASNPGAAQQSRKSFNAYIHGFGGMGISFLSSESIQDLFGDEFGIGLGLPTWSYGLRGGLRHYLEVEFNWGIANHDFNNNSILPDVPDEIIEMDYRTRDFQLKLNAFFWRAATVNSSGASTAFFILWGSGSADWRDKNEDGFEGDVQVFGLEYAIISKTHGLSFSFKRYDLNFEATTLLGIEIPHKNSASDYIMEMKFSFGFGV